MFKRTGDVDHVVVGPDRAIAIETKWSSDWTTRWAERRLDETCRSVAENVRQVRRFLKGNGGLDVPVDALVVVRGPGSVDAAAMPWPVPVVAATHLPSWVDDLGCVPEGARTELASVAARIDQHLRRADEVELADRTWLERTGFWRPVELCSVAVAAWYVTVLVCLTAVRVAVWASPAMSVTAIVVGASMVARRRWPPLGGGLAAGGATVLLVFLVILGRVVL